MFKTYREMGVSSTLTVRPGRFSGALIEAGRRVDPGFPVAVDVIRPLLTPALPWHHKELEHTFNNDPDAWRPIIASPVFAT
jgi:putative hydrolase of the HAD superfamily